MEKGKSDVQKVSDAAVESAQKAVASPRTRRFRSLLFQLYILIALLGFSALALLANTTPYLPVDLLFTRDIQGFSQGWFQALMVGISWFGFTIGSITSIALAVIVLAVFGLRWESISVLFAAISSGAINYLVKVVIRRPRPGADVVHVFQTLGSYSFPSGHVMFYTAFFGFLLFLTFSLLKRSWVRSLLILIFIVLILLVGPSRMYLGEHWASDVLGGYLLGSLALILTIQFYHWGKKRFLVPQPVAATDGVGPETLKSIPITAKEIKADAKRADSSEKE